MAEVWVVTALWPYEGGEVLEVCDTEALGAERAAWHQAQPVHRFADVEATRWEVSTRG